RARRPSVFQRLRKWARRHKPAVATAGVCVVLGLAALVAVLAASRARILNALGDRTLALDRAQDSLAKEQRAAYLYRIQLAHREWRDHATDQAERRLGECPPDLRRWEYHHLRRLCRSELRTLRFPTLAGCYGAALSPDGRRFAWTGPDSRVRVWDLEAGREVARSRPFGFVGLAFSADGKRLAVNSLFGPVRVLDAQTGKPLLTLRKSP